RPAARLPASVARPRGAGKGIRIGCSLACAPRSAHHERAPDGVGVRETFMDSAQGRGGLVCSCPSGCQARRRRSMVRLCSSFRGTPPSSGYPPFGDGGACVGERLSLPLDRPAFGVAGSRRPFGLLCPPAGEDGDAEGRVSAAAVETVVADEVAGA